MQKKITIALILCLTVVAIFATGCIKEKPTAMPTSTPTPTPTPTPIPAVTSTLTTDGLQVTVNSVRKDESDFLMPKSGYTFLIVNLTIKNVGNEGRKMYGVAGMTVEDNAEHSFPAHPRVDDLYEKIDRLSPYEWEDDILSLGQELTGEVGFEIPKVLTGWQFIYWYSGEPKLIWDLEL
ncbi:MAG: DUF4352 domain-containing protein [Euryarchaeota archaeon]|nr:DUF4352 domain-containing protein [Euryarchaeota archaeon]